MREVYSPTAAMIPRLGDQTSFFYLDHLKVTQDALGVCAQHWGKGVCETMYLPVASIAAVLLGPGTSVSTRAVTTITRSGAVIGWVGDGGVRCYAHTTSDTKSTRWLQAQAAAWADVNSRTQVVHRMFALRFGDQFDIEGKTIEQLRGIEGSRMRQLYHTLAKEHGLRPFKRTYDPADWDSQTPANKALSSANSCLYGIVRAAIATMGCSTDLGFLHSGKAGSFVYDIADLYKAEITIPLAFGLASSSNPDQEARRAFRERLHLFGLMPRLIEDIQHVLTGERREREPQSAVTMLWDETGQHVPAGRNWSLLWRV